MYNQYHLYHTMAPGVHYCLYKAEESTVCSCNTVAVWAADGHVITVTF